MMEAYLWVPGPLNPQSLNPIYLSGSIILMISEAVIASSPLFPFILPFGDTAHIKGIYLVCILPLGGECSSFKVISPSLPHIQALSRISHH